MGLDTRGRVWLVGRGFDLDLDITSACPLSFAPRPYM